MKIAFFQTHYKLDSQVVLHPIDMYRIVGPARELTKNTNLNIDLFTNLPIRYTGKSGVNNLTSEYSVGYMSYTDRVRSLILLRKYANKNKMKLIMDFDDNIWQLPKTHIGYNSTHIGTPSFHIQLAVAKDMNCLTCTTSQLKKSLQKWLPNQRIEVVPNFFNPNVYSLNFDIKKSSQLKTIVFFGSESHSNDCMVLPFVEALIKILNEHSNVNFLSMGFNNRFLANKLKKRYRSVEGRYDTNEWKKLWKKHIVNSSISVCPLVQNVFNKSKSPIKYFESAAAKVPFIASDMYPYKGIIKNSYNGFLCKSTGEWYSAMKSILTSDDLKAKITSNAFKDIYSKYQLKDNLSYYISLFNSI